MVYLMSFLAMIFVASVSMRSRKTKECRLVASKVIPRPVETVFEVIEAVERIPVWTRYPVWLPVCLRISRISDWGGHRSYKRRPAGLPLNSPEEVTIRHLMNREFAYRSTRRRDLSYQSLFRLIPLDNKCQLTWEVSFQVHRLPDVLRLARLAADARVDMANSLEYIHRIAVSSRDSARKRGQIFVARRDQAPAA